MKITKLQYSFSNYLRFDFELGNLMASKAVYFCYTKFFRLCNSLIKNLKRTLYIARFRALIVHVSSELSFH